MRKVFINLVSEHSALNEENRGSITGKLISGIQDGALFVNTARAGLIDEEPFLKELQKGRFKAVLDVYTNEPLPVDSPYRDLKNVILFPHMAGPTFDMREKVVFELLKDIIRVENSEPLKNEIPYKYAIRMTTT